MTKHVFGIDLGSKFSLIALKNSQDGNISVIADKSARNLIPSIVSFQKIEKNNISIICGNFAKKRQIAVPLMTIFDTKSMLEYIQEKKSEWPFKIEQNEAGDILICIDSIEKAYHPYEIIGEFLKYLLEIGNSIIPPDEQTKDVVITVPSIFNDQQRAETMKAAQYAGLNILNLLNETTATCITYINQISDQDERNVLVYDIGAQFLDVALFNINQGKYRVLANDGDSHLGGNDFDKNVVKFIIEKFHIGDDIQKNPKKMGRLYSIAEDLRIELSCVDTAEAILDDVLDDDDDAEFNVTIDDFERINRNLIVRLLVPVQRMLQSNQLQRNNIDTIIITGGLSRMRCVKRELTQFFNIDPILGIDPSQSVVIGAAIDGYNILQKNGQFENLTESRFSIGTKGFDNEMIFIIRNGTKLPAQKVERFQTVL